jgi:hypothetical protein
LAAHWYWAQWADLVAEARASVTPHTDLTAADVCAGLASANIISDLPGRLRLRVAQLRGFHWLAAEVAGHLARQPGIRQVTANPATGSLLIYYDRLEVATADCLLTCLSHTFG